MSYESTFAIAFRNRMNPAAKRNFQHRQRGRKWQPQQLGRIEVDHASLPDHTDDCAGIHQAVAESEVLHQINNDYMIIFPAFRSHF
jgi:hypothetical protein